MFRKCPVFREEYRTVDGKQLTLEERRVLKHFEHDYSSEPDDQIQRKRAVYRNRELRGNLKPLDNERAEILAHIARKRQRWNWHYRSQLLGVMIGALLTFGLWSITAWLEREWTREALANAFVGEISALIKYQAGLPTLTFLNSVFVTVKAQPACLDEFPEDLEKQKECKKDLIEPIDKPPERFFVIYESNSDKLGVLGSALSKDIARFYTVANVLREKARLLGDGRFMRFRKADKLRWLEGYIKLHKEWVLTGCALKARIEKRFQWEGQEPTICQDAAAHKLP